MEKTGEHSFVLTNTKGKDHTMDFSSNGALRAMIAGTLDRLVRRNKYTKRALAENLALILKLEVDDVETVLTCASINGDVGVYETCDKLYTNRKRFIPVDLDDTDSLIQSVLSLH